MRCDDIENLLDGHADTDLPTAQRQSVEAHLAICESCSSSWLAARALRRYRSLPTPAARSAPIAAHPPLTRAPLRIVPSRLPSWIYAGVGGAAAATIAWFALSSFSDSESNRTRDLPALTLSLNETRDVSVNIDAAEAMRGVEIRVVLTGGLELEGRSGRSELRWSTDLEPGINRLVLPVVAAESTGGKVLIAVAHGALKRTFVVQIDVTGEGSARRAGHRSADGAVAANVRTVGGRA